MSDHGLFYIVKARKNANQEVKEYHSYAMERVEESWSEQSDWFVSRPLSEEELSSQSVKTCQDLPSDKDTCTVAKIEFDITQENGKKFTSNFVKVYNPGTDRNGMPYEKFIQYYTNLPMEEFPPEAIWAIYRARWQIEIFFKACKQHCFLNSRPVKDVAVADFFTLMSLVTYHIKLLMGQITQKFSGKILSMLSVSKAKSKDMLRYLGLANGAECLPHIDSFSKRSYVKRARAEEKWLRYELYGVFAVVYDKLSKTVKACVSKTNKQHLKSLKVVAEYISRLPPVVTKAST